MLGWPSPRKSYLTLRYASCSIQRSSSPFFTRHCRPFSTPEEGPQPGIVIRFSSEINNGVNFFGRPLAAGDHAYSTANYATKVRGFGVWLENYNAAGLATTPRPTWSRRAMTCCAPPPRIGP